MVNDLSVSERIALDTETTGLNYMRDIIVGISLRSQSGNSYYVPINHNKEIFPEQLPVSEISEALKGVLENNSILKILFNFTFDYKVIRKNLGIQLTEPVADGYVIQHILNENEPIMKLKVLVNKYLGIETQLFDELFGEYCDYREVPKDWAFYYAAKDADITYKLFEYYENLLKKPENVSLKNVIKLETKLLIPVAEMEYNGIVLNAEEMLGLAPEMNQDIAQIKKEFGEEVTKLYLKTPDNQGKQYIEEKLTTLNLNSSKQMCTLLYHDLKIPVVKRFGESVSAMALAKLQGKYPVVEFIVRLKKTKKLLDSFIYKVPQHQESDGKVHTNFNQVGTKTARFSSSKPKKANWACKIRLIQGRAVA